MNSHNLKRWDAWYFRDVPEILKEREGDNLGDGKFSGFQEMGISLNEVFPFLSGDGKFSGFPKMGISLMKFSLFFQVMVNFRDFQKWEFP